MLHCGAFVNFLADNIPAEILARGPEAVQAYIKLRNRGNAPLFRGRLFILGQDRPSNIRFRKALSGDKNSHNSSEKSQYRDVQEEEVVHCEHWCRINNRGQWRSDPGPNAEDLEQPEKIRNLQKNRLNLEEDYEHAIARNIALEIWKGRQRKANLNNNVNNGEKSGGLIKASKNGQKGQKGRSNVISSDISRPSTITNFAGKNAQR